MAQSQLSDVEKVFSQYIEYPWLFVRPGGNWGDHLIYAGAEQCADRLGLSWKSCDSSELFAKTASKPYCIYLHGSGGYNTWGSGKPFADLEIAAQCRAPLVVQGPQTVQDDWPKIGSRIERSLSQRCCDRLIMFAREHITRNLLLRGGLERMGVELCLDHDTALQLTISDVLELANLKDLPRPRYRLTVSRRDNEKPIVTDCEILRSRGVSLDPARFCHSFKHWLRVHLFAEAVCTNRLHSAILMAIIARPVTLTAGSYHKNRSVWDYSLKRCGVQWSDASIDTSFIEHRWLPRILQESYKVDRVSKFIRGVPLS